MSYRSTEIAVEPRTVKRLCLATKLYPWIIKDHSTGREETTVVGVDAFAEMILNEVIREKYPAVLELEKKLAAVEAEAIKKANSNGT